MVDFNNERTIATPATDIERVLILQKRESVMDAIESALKMDRAGVQAETHIIHARMFNLWIHISALLKRHLSTEEYTELFQKVNSHDIQNHLDAIVKINKVLDAVNLTKIDTRTRIDTTDIEAENELHGL